jgi:hypothetical protein
MKDLKIISNETYGFVRIRENSQFNNIKAERVVVEENVTARLFGKVNDVVLNRGSKLFFHGTILGNVKNKGGELMIFPVSN